MRLDDEALRTVFRCFDMDHSGGIDLNELHSAISLLGIPHMSKQKVEKMFADADEDGNGEIDFDEVCVVSRPLRKTPPPPVAWACP
jgi:Ca2+-binding EF-hand superfamily protein